MSFLCRFSRYVSTSLLRASFRAPRPELARSFVSAIPTLASSEVAGSRVAAKFTSDLTTEPAPTAAVLVETSGREYEEVALTENDKRRSNKHAIIGPFGTVKSPALVHSAKGFRYVGCAGGNGRTHRIFWFYLRRGPKHACIKCGQVFQLIEKAVDQIAQEAATVAHAVEPSPPLAPVAH